MKVKTKHICSLIGRTFIISSPMSAKQWEGDSQVNNTKTDYELLDNFISYDEGDLTSFNKTSESIFYVYNNFSSKIEIFSIENGFIICDGLYFNRSWDYHQEINFRIIRIIDLEFKVEGGKIFIYDAVLEGESVLLSGMDCNKWSDRTLLHIVDGLYTACSIEINIIVDEQEVLLKGVMINH